MSNRGIIATRSYSFISEVKNRKGFIFSSQNRENLKSILLSVYGNKEAVDEELIEVNSLVRFLLSFLSWYHLDSFSAVFSLSSSTSTVYLLMLPIFLFFLNADHQDASR